MAPSSVVRNHWTPARSKALLAVASELLLVQLAAPPSLGSEARRVVGWGFGAVGGARVLLLLWVWGVVGTVSGQLCRWLANRDQAVCHFPRRHMHMGARPNMCRRGDGWE